MKGTIWGRIAAVFVLCMALIGLLSMGYDFYSVKKEQEHHNRIRQYIDKELKFEEQSLDQELKILENWIDTLYVSDADLGLLYERISNIYKFQGRTIEYYQTLGYALYYLDKGGDINTAANIYADLANYYITNSCYDRAHEMMDEVYALTDIEEMQDLQVKSYIYRLQAVLDIYDGNYDHAQEQLTVSRSMVDQSNTGIWEGAYYGMIDVQRAHAYYAAGNFEEAKGIIDEYANSPLFHETMYANILARDFIIPYYEVACRLAAGSQERSVAKPLIDEFVKCCETYGFYKSELDTLLYLIEELPPKTQEETKAIYEIINHAYLIQTDMQTEEYTGLINVQFTEAIDRKRQQDHREEEMQHRRNRTVIYLSVILLFLVLLSLTIRQSVTDGLTKIRNRGAFNQRMWFMRKMHLPHGIIMIDIDNFKHLNDTYGHPVGDCVIQRLAGILKSVRSRRFRCYRYGGEEFVIISRDANLQAVVAVGELIRKEIEAQVWEFDETVTISLGVASMCGNICDYDVVSAADENLYHSKQHGKNTLSYRQNGEVFVTRQS